MRGLNNKVSGNFQLPKGGGRESRKDRSRYSNLQEVSVEGAMAIKARGTRMLHYDPSEYHFSP
jgi:hypothetical protein